MPANTPTRCSPSSSEASVLPKSQSVRAIGPPANLLGQTAAAYELDFPRLHYCHLPKRPVAEALLIGLLLPAVRSPTASQRRANGPIVSPWTRMEKTTTT